MDRRGGARSIYTYIPAHKHSLIFLVTRQLRSFFLFFSFSFTVSIVCDDTLSELRHSEARRIVPSSMLMSVTNSELNVENQISQMASASRCVDPNDMGIRWAKPNHLHFLLSLWWMRKINGGLVVLLFNIKYGSTWTLHWNYFWKHKLLVLLRTLSLSLSALPNE